LPSFLETKMTVRDLSGTTAVVTGASRGFGRATAVTLAGLGAHVVGVARSKDLLDELAEQLGGRFTPEAADAADPEVAERLVAHHRPATLILAAGATPAPGPLSEQSWESFGTNWNVDVRHAFNFTREALRLPLPAGAVVVSLSSGAAVGGSPLSGGYAGAKATIRLISGYAADEARRSGSGVRFVAVLPTLTPATELGRPYTEQYAALSGQTEAEFLQRFGGALGTGQAGRAISDLAVDDSYSAAAYRLSPGGLQEMG
jgi:NAD(P)-dependent dehydrogenase (short-subunit alcohol dehydrogenase family)